MRKSSGLRIPESYDLFKDEEKTSRITHNQSQSNWISGLDGTYLR